MDIDVFKHEYAEIEEKINTMFDRNAGAFLLNSETVMLLSLLCIDDKDNVKTLIPNLSMGELALCAENGVGYSISREIEPILEKQRTQLHVIWEDFLECDVEEKYQSILLFPPLGIRTNYGKSESAYIEKSLSSLEKGGRLVALVPKNVLTAPVFKNLREKILCNYSLNAVFDIGRISRAMSMECSILVIENKIQLQQIYMTLNFPNAEMTYEHYRKGSEGFYVDSADVYDRFDASYFDPKYKEIRKLVQNRDTVKLGNLADVFSGIMITAQERKGSGDYLIIKPQYIYDGKVHLGNQRKVFCSRELIEKERRGEKCILKKGDVLISTVGKINWAIYTGDDDFAVANQNVAIIRGKEESEEWLKLFFNTNTGIEYLESQLKFFSHCGVFNHISVRGLVDMAVPDIKVMKIADNVRKGIDLEAKVATLFRDLGWEVKESYKEDRFEYDIALFFNNQLKGVIEVKTYSSDKIRNNQMVARQLAHYKDNLNGASVFLFVDDEIYEFTEGKLEQLAELPRPEKRKTPTKKETQVHETSGSVLQIEKGTIEETSLTDRMLMELVTRGEEIITTLNRIEGKVDDIVEKIETLSRQISGYQSLVDKQLELAISPEEEERIIHAFSEECAERIIGEIDARGTNREYNTELQKLILSFGEEAWNKMEESSRTFLVSSKVIFNNLIGLQDIVDYSGVCLLVTKALEVEMGKRFCKNFLAYLKTKYPGKSNFVKFPTSLLDRYGKPIKPKHFTLGTVAYVLCYLEANDITEEQSQNNKEKLVEYVREKLFVGKTDDEIFVLLNDYAESVEEVKNDYRNPSAHTNELRRVDAEQCFALVIDVEKLMKRMLDSFAE